MGWSTNTGSCYTRMQALLFSYVTPNLFFLVILSGLTWKPKTIEIEMNLEEFLIKILFTCMNYLLEMIFQPLIFFLVDSVPSFCVGEIFQHENRSTEILSKIQNLCSFNVSMIENKMIMIAQDLFPNLDFRRKFVSDREVSTIYEFISKMSLWHYDTAWKLVHWQQFKNLTIFSAHSTSSIQTRISEYISSGIQLEVK
jgi:hypothetical protein